MGIDNADEFGPDLTIDGSVAPDSPESSWDAGQIDASDVDWKVTAEALQIELDKRKEYPFDDGDFLTLGPEIFTGKPGTPGDGVISWKGENFYRTHDGKPPVAQVVNLQPKELTAYKVGEHVEAIHNGDWIPGIVTSKQPGILNVDTERGPVTVGSYHKIRKVVQGG